MSELASRFAQYVGDDLPPEVRAPDAIELGNALLEAEAENARLQAALEPFAKVAERREMEPSVCGDDMTLTVALINGNVTQSVLHWVLKAGDFRRAKSLLKSEGIRAEVA